MPIPASSAQPTPIQSPTSPIHQRLTIGVDLIQLLKVLHNSRIPAGVIGAEASNRSVEEHFCKSLDFVRRG